ncbi:MAG: GDP-mannose 4,6-dehydratase [Proteobacteria bacterium]|nr:GDP-mannose 4,6-dehydratase [Pseudomonadota bacterium]
MAHDPQNILVTGGAGFIGSNFVHYWLKRYPTERVVVLDALTYAGNRENLTSIEYNPQFSFAHGDILHTKLIEKLLHGEQIDTIVHFAAESHVDRSIPGPDTFLKTNEELQRTNNQQLASRLLVKMKHGSSGIPKQFLTSTD